jgi:hypothetical protein
MNSASTAALPRSTRFATRRARVVRERLIEFLLFCAALVSVFTTVGIVYVLIKESVVFFQQVPLADFLTDRQWTPLFDDAHFGIVVLLSGTFTSSLVALGVAIPLGTIIAIYLSEFAPHRRPPRDQPLRHADEGPGGLGKRALQRLRQPGEQCRALYAARGQGAHRLARGRRRRVLQR